MEMVNGINSRLNVLVLEDQVIMQMVYRKALAPTERCFNLLFASSLAQAKELTALHEDHGMGISYALLDWSLPDGTSKDFIGWARDRAYLFRAVVISGDDDPATIELAQRTGVVDSFLPKPVSLNDLRSAFFHHICPLSQFHRAGECCFSPALVPHVAAWREVEVRA